MRFPSIGSEISWDERLSCGLAEERPGAVENGADKPEIMRTMHYRGYVWQIPFLLLIYMRVE
jgi:hypothetical protein